MCEERLWSGTNQRKPTNERGERGNSTKEGENIDEDFTELK